MAVTITDNRTIVNEADTLTGWTGNADSVASTAPDPIESTQRIGTQVSNETQNVWYTDGTARDLTNTIFYIWGLPGGVLETTANGGIRVILGDGTNTIAYEAGGADGSGFRHEDGPVFWQCFTMDTGNLPTVIEAINGSAGAINFGAITEFGIGFTTLAKSVGGQENCFIDISRYGNGGLTITGGGVGTEGNFLEISVADRQIGNQQAYGICRRLGTGLFGLQGPLTFGDSVGTATTLFEDLNSTVVFEDRGFNTGKYYIEVTGNGTGTTDFTLGTRDGEGLGSDGVTLLAPAGANAFISASNVNITTFGLYGCTVSDFVGGIELSQDAGAATSHEIFATEFAGCGQVNVGFSEFRNVDIVGSPATSAVRLIDTTNVSDLSFTSVGTGHAIVIDTPGTYEWSNITFEGYAAVDGSTGNEAFYNNSGGLVTINVSGGGDSPSVRNGTGATTTVNNNTSVTLTGMRDNTEVRVYDQSNPPNELAGIEDVVDGTTDDRSFTFSLGAGTIVDIVIISIEFENQRIENFTIPSNDTSIPISQDRDRNYVNP